MLAQQPPSSDQWKPVEAGMGRPGQLQADGVMKFGLARGDLNVEVSGMKLKPALALGGWVAFNHPGIDAMAMGDLVLAEDDVTPVMTKLQQSGIEITALHNHVLHESPRVMYMHVLGHGDAAQIAKAISTAMSLTKLPPPSTPPAQVPALDLDTKGIEQALGFPGKVNGGVFQVGVPRSETIHDHGMAIPNSMGVATTLNFQPTGSGKAAITGDFVLLGSEVNPVMKALRKNGIEVTAVHSHMLDEEPRLFFMHFWANDDAAKLAKGLREALDQTNSKKPK
jgi:Domain of Unknown Function (DUF1259)